MRKQSAPLSRQVLAEIDAFLRSSGMRPTAFGMLVCGDPSFVKRVRDGRQMKSSTIDRVRDVIASHERPTRGQRAANAAREVAA